MFLLSSFLQFLQIGIVNKNVLGADDISFNFTSLKESSVPPEGVEGIQKFKLYLDIKHAKFVFHYEVFKLLKGTVESLHE